VLRIVLLTARIAGHRPVVRVNVISTRRSHRSSADWRGILSAAYTKTRARFAIIWNKADASLRRLSACRQSRKRPNAGAEEVLRSGWFHGRENDSIEWQRRFQRPHAVVRFARKKAGPAMRAQLGSAFFTIVRPALAARCSCGSSRRPSDRI